MTVVVSGTFQVGDTRRPQLDISPYDGSTVVTLSVICQATGVSTPVTLSGPVVQPGGAGRWSAILPYTMTAPGLWFERWQATNAVTGAGAGAETMQLSVEATPPPTTASGAWATATQYANTIGGDLPAGLPLKLRIATLQLKRYVSLAVYDATDAAVIAAKVEACCLQAKYAADNGWTTGAATIQRAVSIGSVTLGAAGRQDGGSGSVSPIDPLAWQVLDDAGLLADSVNTDVPATWF